MIKSLRHMEGHLKKALTTVKPLKNLETRTIKNYHTYVRFVIEKGQLAVKLGGAGSKGAKPLIIPSLERLGDRAYLDFVAVCLINNLELNEMNEKLYG